MATAAFEEIVETFDFLDDWEDRYRHVIELGRAMPALDPAFQVPATKIDGCASQVWLRPMIDGPIDCCNVSMPSWSSSSTKPRWPVARGAAAAPLGQRRRRLRRHRLQRRTRTLILPTDKTPPHTFP